MGNKTEFARVAKLLEGSLSFDKDINVSVFETNIRGKNLVYLTEHYFGQFQDISDVYDSGTLR